MFALALLRFSAYERSFSCGSTLRVVLNGKTAFRLSHSVHAVCS